MAVNTRGQLVGSIKGEQKVKGSTSIGRPTRGIDVTGAEIGQIIRVAEVDENGKPTKWEATDIPESKLQSVNGQTPDENGNVEITIPDSGQNANGLSATQIDALHGMFKVCAYDDSKDISGAYAAFKTAFGITDSGDDNGGEEEPDTPVEPDEPEVTLSSISATYSGGDVAVGTAVTDLTGIVVTATYSDGSTETITDYTLGGTIAEGSNTITVSYGGKITTFVVTGVAEADPAEIVYYSGYFMNNGVISTSTGKAMAVYNSGKVEFQDPSNLLSEAVYPIDIPVSATKVKITCPNPSYVIPWKIVDGVAVNMDGSGWIGKWGAQTIEHDLTVYEGATHISVTYNVGNGNATSEYDFSGYAIEFE